MRRGIILASAFVHDYTDFPRSRGLDGFLDYFGFKCCYDTKMQEIVYDIF